MKQGKLIKLLIDAGFVFEREGRSHILFKNYKTGVRIPVPRHRGKEIARGTAAKILKQLKEKS